MLQIIHVTQQFKLLQKPVHDKEICIEKFVFSLLCIDLIDLIKDII